MKEEMASIAYIDDNEDCLEIIQLSFEEIGIKIDVYDDPILFYNENKEYKLVISDFHMPQMNGQEFIGLLKKKFPRTKTIIYSGFVEQIGELDLQIDSFLSKPVQFEFLLKTVKFLLYDYEKKAS